MFNWKRLGRRESIKTKFLISILFLFYLAPLSANPIQRQKIPVKKLFDLNPILQKLGMEHKGIHLFDIKKKIFHKDDQDNFYLLETQGHRVIKISRKGKFIKEIGYLGTDELGLYYPNAMLIDSSTLYVVTASIKDKVIKGFSLDGDRVTDMISIVPNGTHISSLAIAKGKIYVDFRNPNSNEASQDLVTIFNTKGNLVSSFGESIKCKSWAGNLNFNKLCFSHVQDRIIGALWYQPIIVSYSVSGKKIFRKNLLDENLPIISEIQKFVILHKMDRPEKRYSKHSGKLYHSTFCQTADVDRNLNLYYSTWTFGKDTSSPSVPVVYLFDKQGSYKKTLVLTLNEKPFKVCYLLIDKKSNQRYAIGYLEPTDDSNGQLFLCAF